jgi:hypothetical protein
VHRAAARRAARRGRPPSSPPLPFSAQIQWLEREKVVGAGQRRSRRGHDRRAGSSGEQRRREWEVAATGGRGGCCGVGGRRRGVPQISFSTPFLDHERPSDQNGDAFEAPIGGVFLDE